MLIAAVEAEHQVGELAQVIAPAAEVEHEIGDEVGEPLTACTRMSELASVIATA